MNPFQEIRHESEEEQREENAECRHIAEESTREKESEISTTSLWGNAKLG